MPCRFFVGEDGREHFEASIGERKFAGHVQESTIKSFPKEYEAFKSGEIEEAVAALDKELEERAAKKKPAKKKSLVAKIFKKETKK